jgi:hypothetical protein
MAFATREISVVESMPEPFAFSEHSKEIADLL